MNAGLLVVSPDSAMRARIAAIAEPAAWTSLDFSDADSAFLFACSRREDPLGAIVVDEWIDAQERRRLLGRLDLLLPTLPAILLCRAPSAGPAHWPSAGVDPTRLRSASIDRLATELLRLRAQARPRRLRTRRPMPPAARSASPGSPA